MKLALLLLLSLAFTQSVLGANILFLFGGGNVSHKISIWPLVFGLAEKGHHVTFVSSSDKKVKPHVNVTDVTPATYKAATDKLYDLDRIKMRIDGDTWDMTDEGYDFASYGFCKITMKAYEEDQVFREIIDSVTFDLAVVNGIFSECTLFLTHHMKLKVILFSSMTMFPRFFGSHGVPIEASSVPELKVHSETGFPMSYFERARNVYKYWYGYTWREKHAERLRTLYKSTFKVNDLVTPNLVDLERNTSLLFINTHYSIDFPRSLPPFFVSIGGMQCFDEIGKLPKEFQDFMDGAEDGVVLITFGSTIALSTLDAKFIQIFFQAMRRFSRFRFIWRWDGPMPEGHPKNLMAAKWLPQREILNHTKTKAFMTHGGLNGLNEATFHGVPLIVLPLFADQDFNAYRVKAQQLGLAVEITKFSQEILDNALLEVLQNPKYKKNMEVRSRMFKDRRMHPVQEAIFWTEFVMRQDDTSALKPMLREQPWFVRNCVDVYFLLFTLVTIFPLLVLYTITKFVKFSFKI